MNDYGDSPDTMNYVLLADCGCVKAVIAIESHTPKELARFIAKGLRQGLSVEKWRTGDVRERSWRCEPHRQKTEPVAEQLTLDGEA